MGSEEAYGHLKKALMQIEVMRKDNTHFPNV